MKVNSKSYGTLIVHLSGASSFGIISSYLFNTAKNSLIYSVICGFILSIILSLVNISFFNKCSDKSINEKFTIAYKKFGVLINILFILLTISLFIIVNYRLTSFLSSQYLTKTYKIVILILLFATIYNISKRGFETITRVSILSLVLSLGIFIFDVCSLIQYINFDNILPIYFTGKNNFIMSSITFALYFSIPTFYINSIRKDDLLDKEKFNKYYYIYFIISFIIVVLALINATLVFGYKLSSLFDYPLYTVLKRITLFSYIGSTENISVSLWVLYIINSASIYLYSIINSIKYTFKINNMKVIGIILLIIDILVPKFLLMKNNYVETLEYAMIPNILCAAIFVIFLVTNLILKKRCKNNSTS